MNIPRNRAVRQTPANRPHFIVRNRFGALVGRRFATESEAKAFVEGVGGSFHFVDPSEARS